MSRPSFVKDVNGLNNYTGGYTCLMNTSAKSGKVVRNHW